MSILGEYIFSNVAMENLTYVGKREFAQTINETIFSLLQQKIDQRTARSTIEEVIRTSTRMKVNFVWENSANAYMRPHDLDKNHIFWQEKAKLMEQFNHSFDFGNLKEGFGHIDLAKGTVAGFLTEMEFTVGCGLPHLLITSTKNLKDIAARTTAIILHEVGHAYTTCLYMGRCSLTNYVLAEVESRWAGMPESKRYDVIKALKKNGVDPKNDNLAKNNDAAKVSTVLLVAHFTELRNELGVDVYSKRGCEALADQYVARAGYGAELALALREVTMSANPTAIYIARVLILLSLTTNIPGFSWAMIGACAAVALVIEATGNGEASEEYDRPERRIKVIENEMVRLLRVDLTREQKTNILHDLEMLRSEMREYGEIKPIGAFKMATMLFRTILPGARARHNLFVLQKQLEDLTASELYVSAAKLENLV